MVRSNIHAESTRGVLREGFEKAEDELLIVNPSKRLLRELIDCVPERETIHLRLFADPAPLKALLDDFLLASAVADLVAEGTFSIRNLETIPRHSLLVTSEFVISLVETETRVAGLTATDTSFVSTLYNEYDDRWARAEEFSLRTPPLTTVRETLTEEFDAETAADFDRMLDSLDTARGDGDGLDEVTISLLVAANNGQLLYDISRWGEDIQLASKATFSRTKNILEDAGLIETEKVPIDVGRPRLRLMLNGSLRDSDIETISTRAQEILV